MKNLKRLVNFDALCGALAIGCLVVLGASTVGAETLNGGPNGGFCGSDHCGDPPEINYPNDAPEGERVWFKHVTGESGQKTCCYTYMAAYDARVKYETTIDWVDTLAYKRKTSDPAGHFYYIGCTWSRNIWDRSNTTC